MAAAAVVSVSMGVMKPVLAKLATLMGDEYKKIKGLRKKVTFLQRELKDMDALLEKMDSADELDPQAKNWRKDIIEMSYNIEDCIDDFMQRLGQTSNKVGILRKAFKNLRTFKDRYHLANQLQEIKAQVMEASERRNRYMLDQSISITAPVAVDPRLSAIYKESSSLVGINAQKAELINWAMDKGQQLKVMAIVGLGGLGKTTLANEVYREVGGKFDCKAFVSVSQKPEMIGLFNSLLSQLGLRPYSHACQLQDPINKVRGHLHDKRYFIVVDDLWDTKAWDTIQLAFPQNNMDSRVMITTRNKDVARSCCSNHGCIHNMRPLSEHDWKKLFFGRIFGSEDACPSELRKVSSEILKKCDGLPLAIITMASMLACQPTRLEGQWEYIQNSLATKFAINSNYEDMMYILDLRYKHLPRHLKSCFMYLGSYPEDHEIDRVELVRRWVAEGFVSNLVGQDIWDAAESYFNELVNRSMIQPIYGRYNNGCTFSRVPRWIGHLRNLRELWLGARQVLQEDIDVIGTRLPSLIHLGLRIPGIPMTERIVVGGSTGFPALELFHFDCDGMSFLAFGAGAMPVLRELGLVFDADEWDKAAPAGLEHLPSLKEIRAHMACYSTGPRRMKATHEDGKTADASAALIRSVFREAAGALPTRPAFTFDGGQIPR